MESLQCTATNRRCNFTSPLGDTNPTMCMLITVTSEWSAQIVAWDACPAMCHHITSNNKKGWENGDIFQLRLSSHESLHTPSPTPKVVPCTAILACLYSGRNRPAKMVITWQTNRILAEVASLCMWQCLRSRCSINHSTFVNTLCTLQVNKTCVLDERPGRIRRHTHRISGNAPSSPVSRCESETVICCSLLFISSSVLTHEFFGPGPRPSSSLQHKVNNYSAMSIKFIFNTLVRPTKKNEHVDGKDTPGCFGSCKLQTFRF